MGPGSPVMKQRHEKSKQHNKTSRKLIQTRAVQTPIKPKRSKLRHVKSESSEVRKREIPSLKDPHGLNDYMSGSENFILRERKPEVVESSAGPRHSAERFVRLTFTPNDPNDKKKSHFTFPEPGLYANRDQISSQSVYEDVPQSVRDWAGSESGIEVVEQEDPYDSIVSKIREVSISRLPSELKLKYVTDLLNVSLKRAAAITGLGSQTMVLDISDDEHRAKRVKPSRSVSMMREKLAKSMGNLTDPSVYSPRDLPQAKSLYSFDDDMTEQKVFESRYKHLKCSFDPEDIGLVLGVMNENRTEDEQNMRSAYSMNDLDSPISEGFMISKYHHSMFDLHDYPESLPSSDEETPTLTGLESHSGDDGGSESTCLQLDVSRLRQCQVDRVVEEGQLAKEQDRFDDIQLEAESFNQDEVEASLRRSEDILNQEEAALSLVSTMSVEPDHLALKKRMSADLGYDSTSSQPVTPSHGSITSTAKRGRRSTSGPKYSSLDNDPLSGPEFF